MMADLPDETKFNTIHGLTRLLPGQVFVCDATDAAARDRLAAECLDVTLKCAPGLDRPMMLDEILACIDRAGISGKTERALLPESERTLLKAIVWGDQLIIYIPPCSEDEAVAAQQIQRLTAREREVLGMLVHGMSSKKVAAELSLSVRTVEKHRERIRTKLSTNSVAELTRLYVLACEGHDVPRLQPELQHTLPRAVSV